METDLQLFDQTDSGTCECSSSTYEVNGQCVDKSIFAIAGALTGCLVVIVVFYFAMRYRARKNDEAWQVSVDELHFDDPVEVIGQGSFGVVWLAEYRGTKVAIKRAVKVKKSTSKHSKRGASGSNTNMHSVTLDSSMPSVPLEDEVASSDEDNDIENQAAGAGASSTAGGSKGSSLAQSKSGTASAARTGSRGNSRSKSDNHFSLGFLAAEYGHFSRHWYKPWVKRRGYRARFRDSILGESLSASLSTKTWRARMCPWFDEQSRREAEFLLEMRVLSRLRHPVSGQPLLHMYPSRSLFSICCSRIVTGQFSASQQ